jgi:hypothetical protein
MRSRPVGRLGHGLAVATRVGRTRPCAPADRVSQKRWHEHCEGGGDAPDEVAVARAHPSSGSTCGGGVEAAWCCLTVAKALQSWRCWWRGPAAPKDRGEAEATGDGADRLGGGLGGSGARSGRRRKMGRRGARSAAGGF